MSETPVTIQSSVEAKCFVCGYDRRGLPEFAACPECGDRGCDDSQTAASRAWFQGKDGRRLIDAPQYLLQSLDDAATIRTAKSRARRAYLLLLIPVAALPFAGHIAVDTRFVGHLGDYYGTVHTTTKHVFAHSITSSNRYVEGVGRCVFRVTPLPRRTYVGQIVAFALVAQLFAFISVSATGRLIAGLTLKLPSGTFPRQAWILVAWMFRPLATFTILLCLAILANGFAKIPGTPISDEFATFTIFGSYAGFLLHSAWVWYAIIVRSIPYPGRRVRALAHVAHALATQAVLNVVGMTCLLPMSFDIR